MKTIGLLLVGLLTAGESASALAQTVPIQQKRESLGVSLTIVRTDQPEVAREAGVEGPVEVTRIPLDDVDVQTRQTIDRLCAERKAALGNRTAP